jgi:hypothetical protein
MRAKRPLELLSLCRAELFHEFRNILPSLLQIGRLSADYTAFNELLRFARDGIPTDTKMAEVDRLLDLSDHSPNDLLILRFSRYSAARFHRSAQPTDQDSSLLWQLVKQIEREPESVRKMYQRVLPWRVHLAGEGSVDAGGPARELFTEIMLESLNPTMQLFVPSPDSQRGGKLVYVPDPRPVAPGSKRERMYRCLGILMSVCLISRAPVPLRLGSVIWKRLTNTPIFASDLLELDSELANLIHRLESSTEETFAELPPLLFELQNALGEWVPLMEGGSAIPVTFAQRSLFVRLALMFNLRQFDQHLAAICRGFETFLQPNPACFTPQELELLIAGQPTCPIDQMKKHVIVPDNRFGQMLWNVLESFTPEERMLFIKFGCGRMSLPAPGLSWSSNLKVHFVALGDRPGAAQVLPVATTCSWTMQIPAYPTEAKMAERLRVAISWGGDIDRDHAPDLGAIDQGA